MLKQRADAAQKTLRLLKCAGQIIEPRDRGMILRQQGLESLVHQQDAAVDAGDDHGLFRHPHMAAELLELVLRNQRTYGTKLQNDVGYRLTDQTRGGDIRGRPGFGRALHQLVPLCE